MSMSVRRRARSLTVSPARRHGHTNSENGQDLRLVGLWGAQTFNGERQTMKPRTVGTGGGERVRGEPPLGLGAGGVVGKAGVLEDEALGGPEAVARVLRAEGTTDDSVRLSAPPRGVRGGWQAGPGPTAGIPYLICDEKPSKDF